MSKEQGELFYESYLEALRDDVKAIGGAKDVGKKFWPQKEVEAARNAVNDRLSKDRRERFDDDQVRYIMRAAREARGFSAAVFYVCDDTGFERPAVKDVAGEVARQQLRFVEAMREAKTIIQSLERMGSTLPRSES